VAGPLAHRLLEGGLPGQEARDVLVPSGRLAHLVRDPAQLGQVGGQRRVVGRPHRTQLEGPGPPPLGPGEGTAGVAVPHGQSQPQVGEVGGVPGGIGTQLGRAERGTVPVEHPDAGPERALGAPAVAVGEAQQRHGVPGSRA
jgi:hypothetical protein